MANELVHKSQGTTLTQAEYENVDAHVCNSQATGDLIYASSSSQLSRLAIGATDTILSVQGGVPTWRTPANILTDLSGQAGAAFDWNSQNLTSIGDIGCDDIFGTAHMALAGGSVSSVVVLIASETFPAETGNHTGVQSTVAQGITAASMTSVMTAIFGRVTLDSTNTQDWTHAKNGLLAGDFSITTEASSSGTVTNAVALTTRATIVDAATVTNYYGLLVQNPSVINNKITNNYGIYIDNQTGGGTLDYGIYIAGADTYAIYVAADDILLANGKVTFSGSVDSAAIANEVSLGGYEISAGHRALAISSEEVVITEAIGASDRTLPVRINGATYKLMLVAV